MGRYIASSLYKSVGVADLIENENEVRKDYNREDSILKKEFEKALKGLKANETPGVDLKATELLQNSKQAEKNILLKLVCNMYETTTRLTKL